MANKKKTKEQFIEEANKKHNFKYDYSLVEYTRSNVRVTVICPKHGEFLTFPTSHLSGTGCRLCVHESLLQSNEQFIEKARLVHGDLYDYSITDYKGRKHKVSIICQKHGEFTQDPNNHLSGKGCRKCANDKTSIRCKSSKEEFVRKSKEVHGDFYDYSKADYKTSHSKVVITCPKHGDFSQKPSHHHSGIGCPFCGKEAAASKLMTGTEEFIEKSKKIHGNKYEYSKVNYKNSSTKVTISCREHGDFEITPQNHLLGSGCYPCSREFRKLRKSLAHSVYVLICDDIVKVGITSRDVSDRLFEINKNSGRNFKILKEYSGLTRSQCFDIETSTLNILSGKYYGIPDKFDGSTECFVDVNLAWLLNYLDDLTGKIMNQEGEYAKSS